MAAAHCSSWDRKKLCPYYFLSFSLSLPFPFPFSFPFPFPFHLPPLDSYRKRQKELCCSLLDTLIIVFLVFWPGKGQLCPLRGSVVGSQMLEGSFATEPVRNMAWKQGLQTLLSYYTSTKSISTENRVKQINLSSGTQGKSILIFSLSRRSPLRFPCQVVQQFLFQILDLAQSHPYWAAWPGQPVQTESNFCSPPHTPCRTGRWKWEVGILLYHSCFCSSPHTPCRTGRGKWEVGILLYQSCERDVQCKHDSEERSCFKDWPPV